MARHVLKGMDGFLASPFMVESVQNVIRLAARVKLAKLRRRIEAATRLVLRSTLDEIDFIAYDAAHWGRPLSLPEEIARTTRVFRAFGHDELKIYFEVSADLTAQASPPLHFVALEDALDAEPDGALEQDPTEPTGMMQMATKSVPAAADVPQSAPRIGSLEGHQEAEKLGNALHSFFMKLAPICRRSGTRSDCPLRRIRSLNQSDRREFLQAAANETLEKMLDFHHRCQCHFDVSERSQREVSAGRQT